MTERITDGMVEAFINAAPICQDWADADDIRAGLVAALARRELERRTEMDPNAGLYPATVGEVADEIARFVLELEDTGVARGLLELLSVRLVAARQERHGY